MLANFCLNCEAAAVTSTLASGASGANLGLRLLVAGADGSVTMLVVADLTSSSMVGTKAGAKVRRMLAGLPSRRVSLKRDEEEGKMEVVKEIRKDPRVRFRLVNRYITVIIRIFLIISTVRIIPYNT